MQQLYSGGKNDVILKWRHPLDVDGWNEYIIDWRYIHDDDDVNSQHVFFQRCILVEKKRRDGDNVIATSCQRCFTNVVSTSIDQRCINVVLQT